MKRNILFFFFFIFILFFSQISCVKSYDTMSSQYFNLENDIIVKVENSILSVTSNNKEFFSFSLKSPFIKGFVKEYNYSYHMASIDVKDRIKKSYVYQKIKDIEKKDNIIQISGFLSDNKDSKNIIPYNLRIIPYSKNRIDIDISIDSKEINTIELNFNSNKNEDIFGGGVQYSYLSLKGKKIPILTCEQGVGRGDQPITTGANLTQKAGGNQFTTYFPLPFFFTSNMRGFHLDNTGYSVFDFSKPDSINISTQTFTENKRLFASFFISDSYLNLISYFTEKNGRMPDLPEWTYGTILGIQGGSEKVKMVVNHLIENGNPVTAIWIQDWCGRRITSFGDQLKWKWLPDETLYPNFKNFVKEMEMKGIRVLGYINPFLADRDAKKIDDDFTNPLLEEAKGKGYLVKDKNNNPYIIQTVGFPAYLLDLTNPEAVKWIKNIIVENLINNGLSGWMADFGEWLPMDAVLHSGVSAEQYHNQYPSDWAKINREAIIEAGKEKEIVFFTRAGFNKSTNYSTLFWLGDQMVSFGVNDGLPSAILGSLTASISGIPYIHSDIGGYTTITNPIMTNHRSKELLLRWIEFEAFTPIFRTHEGNQPKNNWQVYQYSDSKTNIKSDDETTKFYNYFAKIHFALKNYFEYYIKLASKKGIPVLRPLFVNYSYDNETYKLKYQFLVGDELLVAPVVKEKTKKVKLYLPEGKWIHLFSHEIYEGNRYIDIDTPIGKPAIFFLKDGKYENYFLNILKDIQ